MQRRSLKPQSKLPCAAPLDCERKYHQTMALLENLAAAFINTFGITQPSEAARRRASWIIFAMLVLTIVLVCAGACALYTHLRY